MARSVNEIFNSLVAEKQRQPALSALTSTSATAVWRLILYVIAYGINVLEQLWDIYASEVNKNLENRIPHRPKWYRDKVLEFMIGKTLIQDTDRYDTTDMGEDEITAARVIKHAVAVESNSSSVLTIKVAGETDGVRGPVSSEAETELNAYISEIKDAGVRYVLINVYPDLFRCEIDIYYDPMRLPSDVETECRQAIKDYIENLPFNGEYTNMSMIDTLQVIEGVRIAELKTASSATANSNVFVPINAMTIPEAGYFKADKIILNMKTYEI